MVAVGWVMEFGSQRSCNSLTESPKKDNVRTGSVLGPVDELTAGSLWEISLFSECHRHSKIQDTTEPEKNVKNSALSTKGMQR